MGTEHGTAPRAVNPSLPVPPGTGPPTPKPRLGRGAACAAPVHPSRCDPPACTQGRDESICHSGPQKQPGRQQATSPQGPAGSPGPRSLKAFEDEYRQG